MSDNEHSTAALGDSEESSVEYPPCEAIPEVAQRTENDGKVSAVGRGEEPRDVLNEEPSWAKLICDPGELEEQAGPFPGESSAFSGDGEVLAGEAAAEEVKTSGVPLPVPSSLASCPSLVKACVVVPVTDSADVVVDPAVRPVPSQHPPSPLVDLGLEHDSHTGPLEPEVESADRREG